MIPTWAALLIKWTTQVMLMITANAHVFNYQDRLDLAAITSELHEELTRLAQ